MKLYLDELYLSPYTYSVFCALKEKGANFEIEEVAFSGGRSIDRKFQDRSVTDLIPLLEDGDFLLAESMAILEYIEETIPGPSLFPQDPKQRAQARMLLSWYRCGMQALREERSTETIFYEPITKALTQAAHDEVQELTRFLKSILKPGAKNLFGEWSIADAETSLMLHRLICSGDALDPELRAYAEAQWKRPSAREFVVRTRKPFRSYYR